MGRNGKYETHVKPYLKEIQEWYEILNEEQIAKRLKISVKSFENYKKQHPELKKSLQNGKQMLIEDLRKSLKKKALGFTYTERKTYIKDVDGKKVKVIEEYEKYAQPDTGAIHLLLKNLDDKWRNEDKATMDLKQSKLEIEKKKAETEAEEESW